MSGQTATMKFKLKPEAVEDFCNTMREMITDTAKRPGFRSVELLRKDQSCEVLLIAKWDSEEARRGYIAWRTGRGDIDTLSKMVVSEPELELWPIVVASA